MPSKPHETWFNNLDAAKLKKEISFLTKTFFYTENSFFYWNSFYLLKLLLFTETLSLTKTLTLSSINRSQVWSKKYFKCIKLLVYGLLFYSLKIHNIYAVSIFYYAVSFILDYEPLYLIHLVNLQSQWMVNIVWFII